MNYKLHARALVNSVTDVGVFFNTGNALFAFMSNTLTGITTLATGVLIAGVRYLGELKKNDIQAPLPKSVVEFLEKPGRPLMTCGLMQLAGSAAPSFAETIARRPDDLREYTVPAMLLAFSAANTLRGAGFGCDMGSRSRQISETTGQILCGAGSLIAASIAGVSTPLLAAFALAAGTGIGLGLARKNPYGFVQPDPYYAASWMGASVASDGLPSAAYAIYTSAYASLAAQLKHGGVVEAVEKVLGRPSKKANALTV